MLNLTSYHNLEFRKFQSKDKLLREIYYIIFLHFKFKILAWYIFVQNWSIRFHSKQLINLEFKSIGIIS